MHKKNKIKNILQGLGQIALSFLLVSTSLHLSKHDHAKEAGYSMCNPECNSSDHHFLNTDCDECTRNRNNQKICNDTYKIKTYVETINSYHFDEYVFKNLLNQLNIPSRAPPSLL